ncbi:MAG: DUF2231 domain-containing protein [Minisyncoccia bacterium]
MTYNIHPLFVHFPIAFLFIYSLIKIVPVKRWLPKVSWKDIERVLLVVGVLGAFAALSTGEAAESLVRSNPQLVETHAVFATAATWMYGLLLSGEILLLLIPWIPANFQAVKIVKALTIVKDILTHRILSIVITILGLLTLSLTGLLGGVITHGVTADPVAPFVLRILGITL